MTHRCQVDVYIPWEEALPNTAVPIGLLRRLQLRFDICACNFNYTLFNSKDTLQKIKAITDWPLNTRVNHITAICTALDYTCGSMYAEYRVYHVELEAELMKANSSRSIEWFPHIHRRLQRLVHNKDVINTARIIALFITDNAIKVDGELQVVHLDTEIGVQRPSEFVNTKFIDDGKSSFMNMAERYWLIREGCTKNKRDRKLNISERIVKGIYEIYGKDLPMYLIVNKSGNKYSGTVSSLIKEHFKFNIGDIRASYFTWRELLICDEDRRHLRELCHRQGHVFSTAMMDYKREPIC